MWLVGEYANSSYDARCSANELSMFFEVHTHTHTQRTHLPFTPTPLSDSIVFYLIYMSLMWPWLDETMFTDVHTESFVSFCELLLILVFLVISSSSTTISSPSVLFFFPFFPCLEDARAGGI